MVTPAEEPSDSTALTVWLVDEGLEGPGYSVRLAPDGPTLGVSDDCLVTPGVFHCRVNGSIQHLSNLQLDCFDAPSIVALSRNQDDPTDRNAILVTDLSGKHAVGTLPESIGKIVALGVDPRAGAQAIVTRAFVEQGRRVAVQLVGTIDPDVDVVAYCEEPEDVLVIRRSPRKMAAWTLGTGLAAVLFALGLFQRELAAKVTGAVFFVLLGGLALILLRRWIKPRDLLRVGPDGIHQLAVPPRVTIPWEQIADIRVIERGYKKSVGIILCDPLLYSPRTKALKNPLLVWTLKPLMAGLQVLAGWPFSGWVDAYETLADDLFPATFEIDTLGWPVRPKRLVQELRSRWIAAGGHPPPEVTKRTKKSGNPGGGEGPGHR